VLKIHQADPRVGELTPIEMKYIKKTKENNNVKFEITNAGLVSEDRPLTFPYPDRHNRTVWKNHFFTRMDVAGIEAFSRENYGYWI
jgi:hypothetical protein